MNDLIKRELHVVARGQSARFRVIKYAVLGILFGFLYWWQGWNAVGRALCAVVLFGVVVHFFFRYMTKGWEQDWGPYKSVFQKEDRV